ncbi:CDP-glycerol glycerophosphotransferase family protein [Halorussus sp. AFM4]|uniref:CDP-glycerol glycerophosphotransferase family protein n=1 Tax=Halorussus sp. AFM4 TaxID=3421651 RepID=UPI003EC14FFF
MVEVLYAVQHAFMRKTFEAIDRHVEADSAYVPMNVGARDSSESIPEIGVDEVGAIDRQVRRVDPDVVVYNHRHKANDADFHEEYPLVHVRHGASVGRDQIEETAAMTDEAVDAALAPGERWARRYAEVYPDDVDVSVVGVPEADELVAAEPPDEKRVLYAPTNHNYGGGSYVNTAREVLDLFADTDYELLFRPHPADRDEEPGKSLTAECRERIADLPNVTFDDNETPMASLRASDVLLSDYSGIVTEWLHTGRPLVQFTDVAADENEVPQIGYTTSVSDLTIEDMDALYEHGYPDRIAQREAAFRSELGVPMDGRASERAADVLLSYVD